MHLKMILDKADLNQKFFNYLVKINNNWDSDREQNNREK